MREYLLAHALPTITLATKWDKLKPSQHDRRKKEMEAALKIAVFPFSSLDGTGRHTVEGMIRNWVHEHRQQARRD